MEARDAFPLYRVTAGSSFMLSVEEAVTYFICYLLLHKPQLQKGCYKMIFLGVGFLYTVCGIS